MEDFDFNFEERFEPEKEDKFELDGKLEAKHTIKAEGKTEIVS